MKKTFDVIALGELLIDMAPGQESSQGNMTFEACPGGAPCNVLALLSKAGHKTGFIGKVGDDFLGRMLGETIESVGIDTNGLVYDAEAKTTLAFVHKKADGDRDFSFYRKPGADMMLTKEEINEDYIRSARTFHFGTLSMTDEGVKEATLKAIKAAEDAKCLISFDPNLREPLWDSLDDARTNMLLGMSKCHILKISDNEVEFLTGETDMELGIRKIMEMTGARVIFVTLGKDGSLGYAGGNVVRAKGEVVSQVVDTTGAGDTFMGTALHYLLKHDKVEAILSADRDAVLLSDDEMLDLLSLANRTAAKITLKKGALKVMPEIE